MTARRAFPWRDAIGFGMGVLRLAPETFWRMTPRELAYAIAAVRGGVVTAPSRIAMVQLMDRFPDRKPRSGEPRHGC